MELKNALAICLISLFSATLVMLTARSLDSQAAARLEPQLARIVEQLEAIRGSGGLRSASSISTESEPVDDALVVCYFHGNMRCPTCRDIESQSHETVRSDFASELASGRVVWKVLNYEEPSGVELAKRFDVAMPTVILAKMKGGQIEDWKSLDKVWALVQDKPAFAEFVRGEIRQMLGTVTSQAANLANAAEPEIPDPAVGAAGESAPLPPMDIPIPQETMAPPAKAGRVRDPTYKMRAPCARPTRRVARQGSALKSQIRISKCETNSKHEWPKSKTP